MRSHGSRFKNKVIMIWGIFTVCLILYAYSIKRLPNPHYAQVFYAQGLEQKEKKHFDRAIMTLKKAAYHDPQRGDIQYQLGLIYDMKGPAYKEKAVHYYREAVSQDLSLCDAFLRLGVYYYENNLLGGAIRYLNAAAVSAIRRNNFYLVDSYRYLGKTYEKEHKFAKAFSSYLHLIRFDGKDPLIMQKLKDLYPRVDNQKAYIQSMRRLKQKGKHRMANVLKEIIESYKAP
jgi:tetratricopeptide (TPR) repeat protein